MAGWATTFVNTAPEEVAEAFASNVKAAVDVTEVKEEQITQHMLQDKNVCDAGLTETQAKVVTTSMKSLVDTMRAEMQAMIRKEMGLQTKEQREAKLEEKEKEAEQDEAGRFRTVPKGGCKAGQGGAGPSRRADANAMVNDLTGRTAAEKRPGSDITKDEQQARGTVELDMEGEEWTDAEMDEDEKDLEEANRKEGEVLVKKKKRILRSQKKMVADKTKAK
jgi:hypothetical protein